MTIPYALLFVMIMILSGAPLALSKNPKQRQKALDRYARKVNLAITPQVRPQVIRRIVTVERAAIAGSGCGAILGLALGIALGDRWLTGMGGSSTPLLILISAALGAVVAPACTAAVLSCQRRPGPRIARVSSPEVSDYVPELERWSAPVALIGAGCTLAAGWIGLQSGVLSSDSLSAGQVFTTVGAVLGYLALIGFIAGIVLRRRVLQTGQPAATEQELAWDDALRANTLRGMAQLPFVLALASILVTVLDVGTRTVPQGLLGLLGVTGLLTIMVLSTVGIVLDVSSRPSQHYWRRLWAGRQQRAAA